jgi:monofunctional biosynthetic peptidoglycan transglycosylase
VGDPPKAKFQAQPAAAPEARKRAAVWADACARRIKAVVEGAWRARVVRLVPTRPVWPAAAAWLQRARAPVGAALAAVRGNPLGLALDVLRLAARWAGYLSAGLAVGVVILIVLYRWVNPPASTLMLGQSIAGTSIERTWVPLKRISPDLIRAVVTSEDGSFCSHHGVDWPALRQAMEHDRGGSTITMQVVKNLFLWPSRSYVRKFVEIGLAYLVEAVWPKERILEIYLNIAEWGDGVFGVEAAAHTHFGTSAARLDPEESALLAVALPNPVERLSGGPSEIATRLAGRLRARIGSSHVALGCVGVHPQPKPVLRPVQKPDAPVQKQDWEYLFGGSN